MKLKIFALILAITLFLTTGCSAQADEVVIVATFYPMYVFAQNVAADIEGVRVEIMADQSVGCLHDYQLQTRDMVKLDGADALIINGGGMEQFMDKVLSLREDLPVIDASQGITFLPAMHSHDDHEDEHEDEHAGHEAVNPHVWLDPSMAAVQVKNIADGLSQADPEHAQAYRENSERYIDRLNALDAEIASELAPFEGRQIITFHEAFTYFAQTYGLEIAGVIANEPGQEPSTREIAQTCDLVMEKGIDTLFVEPQYPQKAAETIARETGASVYTLDPVVSGDSTPESYENIMRENARILMEALEK